jgi:hypothetical protein
MVDNQLEDLVFAASALFFLHGSVEHQKLRKYPKKRMENSLEAGFVLADQLVEHAHRLNRHVCAEGI